MNKKNAQKSAARRLSKEFTVEYARCLELVRAVGESDARKKLWLERAVASKQVAS